MSQPFYKRAPITEAVIAIYFAKPLDSSDIVKISDKFGSCYPQYNRITNFNIELQLSADQKNAPTAEANQEVGHRRSSSDMTELLVLWEQSFIISQLTPYPGWDNFFQRFVRDWKVWKRVMGFRTIARLGVRYINRIDIPVSGPIVEYETFLNVYPKLPDILGSVDSYAVQASLRIEDIGCKLILNSAAVPAPILDHASFVIDQDIVKDVDPPQSDEAIYELLNKIRVRKNDIFEACISNHARELFQK